MKYLFLFIFLHSIPVYSFGQHFDIESISTPIIKNFTRKEYNANTQNWAIAQDTNGVLWFGNIGRALWYDGLEWGHVEIPNNSIIRSLLSVNDKIYFGAHGDMGEITRNQFGDFEYRSLLDKVPEQDRNFAEVWKIHNLNNILYFQSQANIIMFRDNEYIGTIYPKKSFRFSFVSNGRLYIEESSEGLQVMQDNKLNLVEKGDYFLGKQIWFVGEMKGRLLAATQQEGMFIFENGNWNTWDTESNAYLIENKLFSTFHMKSEGFLFGTVQGGLIISDEEGNIIKKLSMNDGIQNNTVLSVLRDSNKDIWLGLDRGIDYINISSPFSSLVKKGGFGTGYASVVYNSKLYLGTNQGIYTWSEKEEDFILLENSIGQVWSFSIVENELYCCHNNGIYHIEKNEARLLYQSEGAWKMEKIPGLEDAYIAGSYNGLSFIRFGKNPVRIQLEGFSESSRIFEFDEEGQLWMSHGFNGVYKVKFSQDYQSIEHSMFFGKEQGLPSFNHNEVFKYKNEIIVSTTEGFYRYNDITGLMQPYIKWNNYFPVNYPLSKIVIDDWERINLFNSSGLSWGKIENDTLAHIDSTSFLPLRNDFFDAFENISFLSKDHCIIGTIDGFSVYNRNFQTIKNDPLPLIIKRIYTTKSDMSQTIVKEILPQNKKYIIPHKENHIYVEFSIPAFQSRDDISISYELNNELQESEVTDNRIVLEDLKIGTNHLEVIARHKSLRITSERLMMNIVISPPWYKKWYSFVLYFLFLLAIFLIVRKIYLKQLEIVRRREKIRQMRKASQRQLEVKKQAEQAEKELIILRNEKLRSMNRLKAEEIANSTMELVHKNKLLLSVKETLALVQKESDIEIRNSKIKSLLRKIDRDLDNEENWKVFERNFEEVHENFLTRIREKHPTLSSKDLRLCAYLRMNLSSKEIAPLLRISARSVEISRYRLRKKMELEHDTNLSEYILSL